MASAVAAAAAHSPMRRSNAAAALAADESGTRRYAVLGAGFAGVSVAWHLLQHASPLEPVCVDVFDGAGIGAGASGASGGLLHPFSPTGKLLWNAAEAWSEALKLLTVAETSVSGHGHEPIAWRRGILRPALEEKHATNYRKNVREGLNCCISENEAKRLLPGLRLPQDGVALHIPGGINIHPKRYLEALWDACQSQARDAERSGCVGTNAVFHRRHVSCLYDLSGDYDGVVVCCGAQATLLPELVWKLPLLACRGVVVDLHLPCDLSEQFNDSSPSLLSTAWLAIQGNRQVVLGATKEWVPQSMSPSLSVEASLKQLVQTVEQVYPGIKDWKATGFRAGLRAMPPRRELGRLPLVGCIDELVQLKTARSPYFWMFGGLGSRGLIHHAWLGRKVAEAVVSGNERLLPQQLCAWKHERNETVLQA